MENLSCRQYDFFLKTIGLNVMVSYLSLKNGVTINTAPFGKDTLAISYEVVELGPEGFRPITKYYIVGKGFLPLAPGMLSVDDVKGRTMIDLYTGFSGPIVVETILRKGHG